MVMVIYHNFKDLYDVASKTTSLTLPVFKENPLKIEFEKSSELNTVYACGGKRPLLPFAESNVFYTNIFESRRLTAKNEGCKDVYEVTFDIRDSNIEFNPGDTIGIIPHNIDAEVNIILNHLELVKHADLPYKLNVDQEKAAKIPVHVPVKSSLRYVLRHCLEIRSVVKKLFILALSKHTKDEKEKKVLEYLSSKEGSTAYTTHILNKNICILDLFTIFHTCKPPIEVLLAYLPRLFPRPYSIVNSGMKNKNILKICFSVIDVGNNRKGLTTGWLERVICDATVSLEGRIKNLSIGKDGDKSCNEKIPIYLRKNASGFSMPKNLDTPLLLLGPGTGVAPFVGFLEERQNLKEKVPEFNLGAIWLFFGCRNPELDFIYEKELTDFLQNGTLKKLNTAFSRVELNSPKYIQDALLQNGEEVAKFITKGATIFICGDLNSMAAQIKDALVQCLVKYNRRSLEEAEKYIGEMQKDKRYVVDIWS